MAARVIGGIHDGASFAPSNGNQAQTHSVEAQIVEVRRNDLRAEGRMRDEMERGFKMIAVRRKTKHKID